MRIDLHTHSTASDGTTPPGELMLAAANAGLDVVALTDHDTTAGWESAAAGIPAGLALIPGAEISCRWSGEQPPVSIHLLAYLFDPAEPDFAAERARVRSARSTRAERMVELLRSDGVAISWADVAGQANGAPVGRPHIGMALVAAGCLPDLATAFRPEWLGRRYRLPKEDGDVFEAVRLIRGARGVPVFAHAKASRRGRIVPDTLIAELAAAGLAGLEVDHADHDQAARMSLSRLAADLGLIATGSSDYHGDNKLVRLGDNATTTEAALDRIVAAATGTLPVRRPLPSRR